MIERPAFTFACTLILAGSLFLSANSPDLHPARTEPFAPVTGRWVDSVLGTMTLEQKVRLLFVQHGGGDEKSPFSGSFVTPHETKAGRTDTALPPLRMAHFRDLPSLAPSLTFPSERQLSAIRDTAVLRSYFSALATWAASHHINFVVGPSLNLYYNDFNPLTVDHSFGDEPEWTATAATLFLEAFREHGILVAFDQFPGIGNAERGFGGAPPLVFSNRETLRKRDLVPYKAAINAGLQAMVIAPAVVPGVDSSMGQLASYSRAVMHALLREELGFQGLCVADLHHPGSEHGLLDPVSHLQRGGQLMIAREDAGELARKLQLAVETEMLSEASIDRACRSVLMARKWIAHHQRPRAQTPLAPEHFLHARGRKAGSASMVLLRNEGQRIPLKRLDTLRIAYIKIGKHAPSRAELERYAPVDRYHIDFNHLETGYQALSPQLPYYNFVILSADGEGHLSNKRFGLSEHTQSVIDRIANRTRIALVWNGHHKALAYLAGYPREPVILLTHAPSPQADDLALQSLFGGRPVEGVLRPGVKDLFERKSGEQTSKTRLAYGLPEELDIDSRTLAEIDAIARKGIREKAYPGCQVWLAKDGMVVVDRAYGQHTYDVGRPVETTDLYDLASITKIAGSTAALMHLTDEGLFNLDLHLCDYLPGWVDTTAYMNLNFREILAHQAGLPTWIPFYTKTLSKGVPRYDVYSLARSETYPHRVANNFYIRKDYPDVLFRQILNAKLSEKKEYKYSDVGYYFAKRVIERLSGTPMERYLDSVFYAPLGLSTMTYRPLEKFDKERIVPTEYDRTFRKQLIHGDVHDPGAAMLGGVGGHAGLFSNANDLGILMQMYLQRGDYGGRHYLDSATLDDFIRCQFCENDNRRGAGFDKPFLDGTAGPTCGCTDRDAFGHQGFTGTTTWADPAQQVVYVFLSNRVYPTAENKKLLDLNIRTDIQQVFYNAIRDGKALAEKRP